MQKDKISWCKEQKKGIKLVESSEHLSKSYMEEAQETLEEMLKIDGKWKVITAYYSCYNALYSILIKCGIKCEIHDCSIRLMGFLSFSTKEQEFLIKLKKMRINAQYYLKKETLESVDEVKRFVRRCKETLEALNQKQIDLIRNKLENQNE